MYVWLLNKVAMFIKKTRCLKQSREVIPLSMLRLKVFKKSQYSANGFLTNLVE